VRGDAYLAVGGFPPLPTGEDHALWNALRALLAPRSRRDPSRPDQRPARDTGARRIQWIVDRFERVA
jgi:hypothetical protein